MNVSSFTEWQTTLIILSGTIVIKTDLCYCFQDLLALIKRSLHTQFIHIALFLLLVVVLFSSQKKIFQVIISLHLTRIILKGNILQTGHIPCLFSLKIALHKASPFSNLSQYYTKISLCK